MKRLIPPATLYESYFCECFHRFDKNLGGVS